jgi:hypothetical protein
MSVLGIFRRGWSLVGRALDVLHGVYRQDIFLLIQFETEFAEDREN